MKNKLKIFKSLKGQTFDSLQKNNGIDKIIRGVAGIIKSAKGELFLVVEKEKKAWKKPGQLSFPMETLENGESFEKALMRGLKEEMGIDILQSQIVFKNLFIPFVVFDEKTNKIMLVELCIYDVILTKKQIKEVLQFTNGEVGKVKKMKLGEFLSCKNLRPGNLELFKGKTISTLIKDGEYFED